MALGSEQPRGQFGSVEGGGIAGGAFVTSVNGATGVLTVTGADGVTITTSGTTITIGQNLSARWNVARCRVYAVDGVNGNDANAGFADPASSSAGDYAIACAAAGAVAKKTIAGLAAIFPRQGAGRLVEIVIAAATYTDGLELVLDGVVGYALGSPTIRGTVTNATAGSVAFAGSTADVTMAGGVTVTGLNAPGYNPTGVPTSSVIQCLKVGGAAPAFAAEPAVPLGWRIRFDSATTTAALRNICRSVSQVTGTDTVFVQTVLPAVPVAGDTFYLEQAGVVVPAFTTPSVLGAPPNTSLGIQFVGVRWGGNSAFADIRARFAFCGSANFFANGTQGGGTVLTTSQSFTHPVLGSLTVGGGMRSESASAQFTNLQCVFAGLVTVGSIAFGGAASTTNIQWGAGCASRNMFVANCSLMDTDGVQSQGAITTNIPNLGANVTVGIPRLFGDGARPLLVIDGSTLRLDAMSLTNAGANPAIKLAGVNRLFFTGIVAGSTSNTDIGMDLQNAERNDIVIVAGKLPTVTGTAGDLRMSGQALSVWTNLNFQETWDIAGNHLMESVANGEYRHATSPSVALGVNNSGAAIAAAYELVRNNGTNLQFVPAQANTAANAASFYGITEAVVQNGAAGLVAAPCGLRICQFDGAPVVGAIVYLSPGTAGLATTTVPALAVTNQKLRLGVCVGNSFPGQIGLVRWNPENIPVLADGLP